MGVIIRITHGLFIATNELIFLKTSTITVLHECKEDVKGLMQVREDGNEHCINPVFLAGIESYFQSTYSVCHIRLYFIKVRIIRSPFTLMM